MILPEERVAVLEALAETLEVVMMAVDALEVAEAVVFMVEVVVVVPVPVVEVVVVLDAGEDTEAPLAK